ncbi:MAG: HypC/HybG/HupF family hydrogenase formation chaperone [Methylococcaceae bacterium]|jgi:hydrogenase expression/formation protein HypC|nr:HypC/HybG/HupF family hydrogenase formation chaperone [Methylococcaceae bacterium]MDZ4097521.1 HypC/HybG/HupF family hydrogenase formation chaperone [Methylophilaceae bacterium]MDZ4155123.1 HypC/HybG/HupF family hydrogenase formation chaperone [Methylococcales bacterium]MDP2394432.1 HypC/HybG/HupF family hydrogenase formation chaperone [Methylococcaceae bacterium]MDP3021475.1 HypC/HybG/HupF family hydrogenase formation chaperone [Methylococcaceae bacterium]
MCLAVPGRIICLSNDIDPLARKGQIDFSGITKEISLAYVPEAGINDYVIVHAGFAISVLDEEEAHASLQAFQALDEFRNDE